MDPLKIKGRGRLRVQMRPDDAGITFWVDSEDHPEFWCELRLSADDLAELVELVELARVKLLNEMTASGFLDFLPFPEPDVPDIDDVLKLPDVPFPTDGSDRDDFQPSP